MNAMTTGKLILCVEDEREPVSLFQSTFIKDGYAVLTATSSLQALQLILRHRVNVIVLNYLMPDASSEQLAEEMKRLQPRTPIILFSDQTSIPPSRLAHVDAFVNRAEGLRALLTAVQGLLHPYANPMPAHRRFFRFFVKVPVVVTVSRTGQHAMLEGISRTLGEGGLGCRINGQLMVNEYVRIRIVDRRLVKVLEPRAQVRNRKEDNYGLAFLDISPSELAGLRQICG